VFAKGVNKGYLDKNFLSASETTFRGVIAKYGTRDANGFLDLAGTCKSAGLGGTPYRDGSLEYYASEPQHVNDMKALGPLLLAAIELENAGLNLTTISK